MMSRETINGGHLAPTGYARPYIRIEERGCARHAEYWPGCTNCTFAEVTHTVALVDDVVALILDENGDVIDWLTDDTGPDTARTLAHEGEVVVRESAFENPSPTVVALVSESRLYADCFGVPLSKLYPSVLPVPAMF